MRARHTVEKWHLNAEPALGATRRQKPMWWRTCFMKAEANVMELTTSSLATIVNPVKLQMAPGMHLEMW